MTQPVPHYDKALQIHMRKFLRESSKLIDLIASDQVPFGSQDSAILIDALADIVEKEDDLQLDDDEWQELKNDRQSLVNLYGAAKKRLNISELYFELGGFLRKYGLYDEEIVLLEDAIENCSFSEANLVKVKDRLSDVLLLSKADSKDAEEPARMPEDLQRAFQKEPLVEDEVEAALEQCTDDRFLFDIACKKAKDIPDKPFIRKKAARLIRSRDYQYAISSQLFNDARTSMVLNLFDSLEGDDLFIARTILTDLNDSNKLHMLLYCKDEALLMLGWRFVYGARRTCADNLQALGSRFPKAYEEMDREGKLSCEKEWLAHAAELALKILGEDETVRDRIHDTDAVDSEPLHFFISIHHPRLALRWWHASKLQHPELIAYVGSWTSDDQIKEKLAVRINSTKLITEMLYGDLSGVNLVFGFHKPDDLTLQDRFCVEIMKNHPDLTIREFVRTELLKGNVEIPGFDQTKPLGETEDPRE